MKLYAILISSVVLMAFGTGYTALSLRGSLLSGVNHAETVKLQSLFRKRVAPHQIVDIRSLYYLKDQLQLLDPSYTLSRFQTGASDNTVVGLEGCFFSGLSVGQQNYASPKEWLWEEYRCKRIERLPQNFFLKPPYMHSKGYSYVYLAMLTGKKLFTTSKWVQQNIPLFHITELEGLEKKYGKIKGGYGILKNFSRASLWALLRGENSLISPDFYFLKVHRMSNNYGLVYAVYKRKHLDDFLATKNYKVSEFVDSQSCAYRDGQVCWSQMTPKISDLVKMSSFYVFLFSLLIVFIVLSIIFNRIRRDRRDDEKKKLALQVLTHEFRTPIAHLMLISEALTGRIDQLPGEAQELTLKLSNSVHRLKRLTEMSQKYLRAENDNKLVQLKKVKVPSINEFFLDFMEPYKNEVKIQLLSEDRSFKMDPYWVLMCLKNIVDNALVHGKKPVNVQLTYVSQKFSVKIQDKGDCPFADLDEMSSPFVKGGASSGMGLGLNIVKKVMEDMGAELSFSKSPTTFILSFKKES